MNRRRRIAITLAIGFTLALGVTWHLANNAWTQAAASGFEKAAYASAIGTLASIAVAMVPSKRMAPPYQPQFDDNQNERKTP